MATVLAVLAAGAILRIVYQLECRSVLPYYAIPVMDAAYYDDWAQRIASGSGYGPQPFYLAPLYPTVLGLLYVALGRQLDAVYSLQALLGLVNLLLVYLIGRRLFGHATGLLATVLLSFYAPLLFLETKLLTETMAVTLNLASVLLFIAAAARPAAARFLAAGVVLGLSALCRPAALITAILFLLRLLLDLRRHRRGLVPALCFVSGVAAAVLPVTARNYVTGHDLVLISSNGGMTFAHGNNSLAQGLLTLPAGISGSIASQQEEEVSMASAKSGAGRPLKPSASSSFWYREGLRFIVGDPPAYLWLLTRKFLWSIHGAEPADIYSHRLEADFVGSLRYLVLPFSFLGAFGLFGFAMNRSRARMSAFPSDVLTLYILSVFLSLLAFYVSSRYRVPAAPGLAVFAASGALEVIRAVRLRDKRTLVLAAACIAPTLAVSLVPFPVAPVPAVAYNNLGAAYALQGRSGEAILAYEEAVRLDPGLDEARLNLSKVLMASERFDEAVPVLEEVLRRDPGLAAAHNNLAVAYYRLGRCAEAWKEADHSRQHGRDPHPDFLRELSRCMPPARR